MSTSTLISDYIGRGTHAARPSSPNVASGCTALYYETDTTNTFAWNGSAWVQVNGSAAAGASIVQVATAIGTVGSVTFGVAPTAGNMLIAMVADFGSSLINGTGWTSVIGSGGGGDGFGYGWKVAGASESTTQTPSTDTSAGVLVVWEIALGNAGTMTFTKDLAGAAPSRAFNTFKPGQLCIGLVDHQAASVTPTATSGMDHHTNLNGGTRSLTYFDVAPAAAGAQSVSATYAGSATNVIAVLTVG